MNETKERRKPAAIYERAIKRVQGYNKITSPHPRAENITKYPTGSEPGLNVV